MKLAIALLTFAMSFNTLASGLTSAQQKYIDQSIAENRQTRKDLNSLYRALEKAQQTADEAAAELHANGIAATAAFIFLGSAVTVSYLAKTPGTNYPKVLIRNVALSSMGMVALTLTGSYLRKKLTYSEVETLKIKIKLKLEDLKKEEAFLSTFNQ